MCTPIGHSLFGVFLWAAMILPARRSLHYLWRWTRRQWEGLLLAVLMANLCDLDYLPGLFTGELNAWHHMYTHSIGWIILAGVGTCLVWKGLNPATEEKYLVLLLAALVSHLVLDWFTEDGSAPFGILAGWPFTLERTLSPVAIFPKASKNTLADLWQLANLKPVLVELALMGTLLLVVLLGKTRKPLPVDGGTKPGA
jgi:LexA-binding, inner membrane-associated putative hydrolase